MNQRQDEVQMIPIDKITVLNPRSRGKKKFKQIVANIAQIGLKKPITVAEYQNGDGEKRYFLAVARADWKHTKASAKPKFPQLSSRPPRRI